MTARKAVWVVVILAVAVTLPLAAHWLRGPPPPGCALDGAPIDPAYWVTVVDDRGEAHAFCCIRCAQLWLAARGAPPRSVAVADEAGSGEIDAASAYFVRSSVVTTPAVGNRIHAFRDRADAERHAEEHGGTVLTGAERPFR
jgi:NosL protein